MPSGVIKIVVIERGFGFIEEQGGPDVFFHFRALRGLEFDEQLIGRRVLFELEHDREGRRRAANVRPAD